MLIELIKLTFALTGFNAAIERIFLLMNSC